ncbi:hypothetical protein F5Y16DRAFT_144612 [Xylariaceae sp. FL0255]|nr:hypothetical protein F5Y16DRAFT_144612 [Xylariaceae sp. FL0255]
MYTTSVILLALSAASLVSAHGKVIAVTGDQGGNGTALGILGAAVPLFGNNDDTETDTTVFGGNPNDPMRDGLGETSANGNIQVSDLADAVSQSGTTLPQVSGDGSGVINGTWQIVTSDGTANDEEGKLFAVIDESGTGEYSKGTQVDVESNMVGRDGNTVQKRADNVGAFAQFSVKIPSGLNCAGSDSQSGQSNFCLMKVVNNNGAGPFGGNVAFQIAGSSTGSSSASNSATPTSTTSNDDEASHGRSRKSKDSKRGLAFKA